MKTFNDIYNSLKQNLAPQPRTLIDIGIILYKTYSILKYDTYIQFLPFEITRSAFDTDATTIERLIKELNELKSEDNGTYILKTEGLERVIADVKRVEIETISPSTDNNSKKLNFTSLKAHLLYLINISREGLVLLKQKIILDNLEKLRNKRERINFLTSIYFKYKQNERLIDKVQYTALLKFIELELEKWDRIIEYSNDSVYFSSAQELFDFVSSLVKDKLLHNIRFLDGYRNFWRDEQCIREQKKENEIHPFIKSILKPYCDNRKVKISRENAVANGRIDMTFTYLDYNICLEVKKAHHQNILGAINTQLTDYMIGEETDCGIYLILWYKSGIGYKEPKKYNNIDELIADIKIQNDKYQYQIIGIDCSKPDNPSKK